MAKPGRSRVDQAALAFAGFTLDPARRTLRRGAETIRIGGKAFDLLTILTSMRGEVVSHADITGYVWPDTLVDEVSIRVQVAALRRMLEANGGSQSWIKNVARKGYCFVEPVASVTDALLQQSAGQGAGLPAAVQPAGQPFGLPFNEPFTEPFGKPFGDRMVGRRSDIETVRGLLAHQRTVSIVGFGGVGKTTVAQRVARLARGESWRVAIAELASAGNEDEIINAIAFALGVTVFHGSPLQAIERLIAEGPTLIVLDNCEHVIAETAQAIGRLRTESRLERFLVTSREPVRTSCEYVYRLKPLSLPDPDARDIVASAMRSEAVQLFVERARAAGGGLEIEADSIADVCDLCVALDGVPLAIELAAAAMQTFGIAGLSGNLDDRFAMLIGGSRNAPARHRSLKSVLDWSYEILNDTEKVLFRRSALFFHGFDLDAAEDLLGELTIPRTQVVETVRRLVDKSLLTASHAPEGSRFVFPECTREYGRLQLSACGDVHDAQIARARHLRRRCEALVRAGTRHDVRASASALQPWFDDIRATVNWALKQTNPEALALGVSIAWMSAPLWYFASSLQEYAVQLTHAREVSVASLQLTEDERFELLLASAHAVFHTEGPDSVSAKQLFEACLQMDTADSDGARAREAMYGLVIMAEMSGGYASGFELIDAYRATSATPLRVSAGFFRLNALVSYYVGRFGEAARSAAMSVHSYAQEPVRVRGRDLVRFEHRAASKVVLARSLWILGNCDDALTVAFESVADAADAQHDLSVCYALASGPCIVAAWLGDAEAFRESHLHLTRLSDERGFVNAQQRSRLLRLVQLPDAPRVDVPDEATLETMPAPLHELLTTLNPLILTSVALERAHDGKAGWATSEIIRVQGERMLAEGEDPDAIERTFLEAIRIARSQQALSWELRSAISLAKLRRRVHEDCDVEVLLAPVVQRFKQGERSHDLRLARSLLDSR